MIQIKQIKTAINHLIKSKKINIRFISSLELTKEQLNLIKESDNKIRQNYANINSCDEISIDLAKRKRMIYRSKQRGWLEVDLLLGSWAAKNIMNLNTKELSQYDEILKEETVDIYNYLLGIKPLPENLQTPIMKTLQKYCASSPLGRASPNGFEENKEYMSN